MNWYTVTATARISSNEFIQAMPRQGDWLPACNEMAIEIMNEVDSQTASEIFSRHWM